MAQANSSNMNQEFDYIKNRLDFLRDQTIKIVDLEKDLEKHLDDFAKPLFKAWKDGFNDLQARSRGLLLRMKRLERIEDRLKVIEAVENIETDLSKKKDEDTANFFAEVVSMHYGENEECYCTKNATCLDCFSRYADDV